LKKNGIKIYLSGAITSDRKYKEKFAAAQERLEKRGYEVINPVEAVEPKPGKTWLRYLVECLEVIEREKPDLIYLLKGWDQSNGSKIEREVFVYWGFQKKKNMILCEREDI